MSELKILYLEDSGEDAALAARVLEKAGINFSFRLVDSEDEYLLALGSYMPDVILADHSLFQFNSSEALRHFRRTGLRVPFILVTGTVSEEFAVNILKEGADDYLLKSNLARLPNAIMAGLEKYRLERERKAYMEHVIENEALMKHAEELAGFGSWEADGDSGEVKWSDGIYRICGYQPGVIQPGHNQIIQLLHPEDRPLYQQALYATLTARDSQGLVLRLIDSSGRLKYVSSRVVVRHTEDRHISRLLGFMQDITEKVELEKELAMQAVYQQKMITEITIQAQEKERNELGQELHDNINQVLATVKMYLRLAVETGDQHQKNSLLENGSENIDYAIEEIRKLSRSLVSPSLGDLGLLAALQDLADDLNMLAPFQVMIVNETTGRLRLDKTRELMLYRIAQEQLNNIRKYAGASNVVITLKQLGNVLHFSVADDGQGFDVNQKAPGIGLKNIHSRVEFYAGTVRIISAPGAGCKLEVSIPLEREH